MSELDSESRQGRHLTLLNAQANTAQERDNCAQLLSGSANDPDRRILFVSNTLSPDELVSRRFSGENSLPAEIGVIAIDEFNRSTAASGVQSETPTSDQRTSCRIKTAAPGNLSEIGVQITEFLDRWAETDGRIFICFDSLTVLSQYVSTESLFRFVHVLRAKIQHVDAQAHFHLDPTAVGNQLPALLKTLMDDIVPDTSHTTSEGN